MSEQDTDQATVSWKEAKAASTARRETTKTLVYNMGTKERPLPTTWKIRMLSQKQKDDIEDRAVKINPRGRSEDTVKTDSPLIKKLCIRYGVAEGPEGWTGSAADIDDVCADVDLRDFLADSIDKFTLLDEETRIGFR